MGGESRGFWNNQSVCMQCIRVSEKQRTGNSEGGRGRTLESRGIFILPRRGHMTMLRVSNVKRPKGRLAT